MTLFLTVSSSPCGGGAHLEIPRVPCPPPPCTHHLLLVSRLTSALPRYRHICDAPADTPTHQLSLHRVWQLQLRIRLPYPSRAPAMRYDAAVHATRPPNLRSHGQSFRPMSLHHDLRPTFWAPPTRNSSSGSSSSSGGKDESVATAAAAAARRSPHGDFQAVEASRPDWDRAAGFRLTKTAPPGLTARQRGQRPTARTAAPPPPQRRRRG